MSLKCRHCGEPLKERDTVCPRCGAAVEDKNAQAPRSINELQQVCAMRNVPLEKIRFFIGEDCREPKAFGIYQDDDGQFVVYKNKADGMRAVRYRGPDEAYAVNEIYQKLCSEVALRRAKKRGASVSPERARRRRRESLKTGVIAALITVLLVGVLSFIESRKPQTGYYRYNDDYYYYYSGDWYWYDEDDWYPAGTLDEEFLNDYRDYRVDSYDDTWDVTDFTDSGWYSESGGDSDDGDWNDDDWDDWDFDATDWDSDW